ncbi:acyltransferase [Fibrobacter sp.]
MKIFSILRKIRYMMMSPMQYARHVGVKMGKGCSIDTKNFGTEPYLISLGDGVRIARFASFYTHGGIVSLRKYYNDPNLEQMGKISIGDYTSIGAHCLIMPGVSIGKLCIVGGGSVVTKSIPDGCMVAGNPAKFIGFTDEFYKRVKANNLNCKGMTEKKKKEYLLSLPEERFIHKKMMDVKLK